MAYSSDITKILTDQITKFVTLNRHQLAGHVANLDFWTGEVRHCLNVIDGDEVILRRTCKLLDIGIEPSDLRRRI